MKEPTHPGSNPSLLRSFPPGQYARNRRHRAARPLNYPRADFGPPSINLVALETTQPSETRPDGKWFEAIKPADIRPQNLHETQLKRRLELKKRKQL